MSVVATFDPADTAALRRFVRLGPRGSRRMWIGQRCGARVATVTARVVVDDGPLETAEERAAGTARAQLEEAGSPAPRRLLTQVL